jgi:exopolysaccharide biosynthesis polyprenyl glycosylphosphotransferase
VAIDMHEQSHATSMSSAPEQLEAAASVNGKDLVGVEQMRALTSRVSERGIRPARRGWIVRRMLVAADVVGLATAFATSEALFRGGVVGAVGAVTETAIFVLLLPAWILVAKLSGLYDRDEERATHSTADEVLNVFLLVTVGVWIFYSTSWLGGLTSPDQEKLTAFWLTAIVGVITARLLARTLARRHHAYVQNAIVVGAGDVGQLIGRKLLQHPEYRINLVGYVDATPKEMRRDLGDVQLLGEPANIVDVVKTHAVDRVIIAFSQERHAETLRLIAVLREHDVQVDVVPRLFEALSTSTTMHGVEGLPLLGLTPARIPRSSRMLKRSFDVAGAALLLAVSAPLMLVIALLIRRDSKGGVFFRQERLGMNMRPFTVVKFRTMRQGTEEEPHRDYIKQIMTTDALPTSNRLYKLERSEDVTRVGRWLRRTSLDELPQLLNVLRGDMSLVGPRPPIPYELELFEPHHYERFNVPAGLTGLWQVEARAHSTFREALDLDTAYARSWSLGLDMRLLLRTPAVILRRRETA